jgi:outer membrane immunogenic protein
VAVAAPLPHTWTGFYVGGNLGYGVSRDPVTESTVAGPATLIPAAPAGTPLYGAPPAFNLSGQGVIGGGQIGYNFQFAPSWMVGVETDIQGSHLNDSVACVLPCGTPIAIISGSALAAAFPVIFSNYSVENDLRWFGTLRGRVGWVSGPVLVYFTGGLAYADIERSASVAGRTTIGE